MRLPRASGQSSGPPAATRRWTDRVVAVSVRLVVDADVAHSPSCVDTGSIWLRNANGQ